MAARWWAGLLSVGRRRYIWRFLFHFGDWTAPDTDVRGWLKRGPWVGTAYLANSCALLARIAGLFSRRGFNIDSLAVGPTEHPEVSRMTIVVNVEESPLEQVTKQLNKLVEVIKIVELDGPGSVNRELLLVKVRADVETRSQVLDAVQLFKARVVDVAPDAITIEVTGNADKLAGFLAVVEPFGIRELVQSGMVAIGRGSRSISERTLRPVTVPAPPAAG